MKEIKEKADVCVIGSGAGGAVCAKELQEAHLSVVIMEKGGDFSRLEPGEDLFKGSIRVLAKTRALQGNVGIGNPMIPVAYGSCVGGSTALNAGTSWRVPQKVLRTWRDGLGLEVFTDDYVSGLSERVERFIDIGTVSDDIMGMSGKLMRKGVDALGWSGGPVKRNASGCKGCGACVVGCPYDAKKAMHLSYVPRAIELGARLHKKTRAERILTRHQRVAGVEGIRTDEDGRRWKVTVKSPVVVVAGGAVSSALLLLRNGIANSSGQVGRNLRVHPGVVVGAIFDEDVECWKGVPQSYYCDEFLEEGIIILVGALPPPIGALIIPDTGAVHKGFMARYRGFTDAGALISDTSSGRVRAVGHNALITYSLTDADVQRLKKGFGALIKIYFAAGAKSVFPLMQRGIALGTIKQGEEFIEGHVSRSSLITGSVHPMGTARMGRDRTSSVVDMFLESHDVKGLFVCDASVFPTSIAVNPQESIMTLAMHASEHIVAHMPDYS
ncbi:MAG: GMC family oxidoreductase [Deltaproteobacteria bacterium]|nr:GMC family oxidoreductase [Deltaproteobacteria bacterium]